MLQQESDTTTVTELQSFDFGGATERLRGVVLKTPLQYNTNLSKKYGANIYLKREDMQVVRSYKLRGAYNKMKTLTPEQMKRGVVCASAGNHAQGFAYSCRLLKIKGVIFMPVITPGQKISHTKMFGEDYVEVRLVGDTYDACAAAAKEHQQQTGMTFIPAFDDLKIIEGQATVGVEILKELSDVDYLFIPVGGGGLASGTGTYFKQFSPRTKVIGVEPEGAPSLYKAFEAGGPVTLSTIDTFVDGASVKRTGDITYRICREVLADLKLIPEGKVCSTLLHLYNEEGIIAEPAGTLSVAALDDFAEEIKGKNVVCIISGGNNDISRTAEMQERALVYEGMKHYFLINFAQRPGALKEFVNNVLSESDDITLFEYVKKINRESGPALVGIEQKHRADYQLLISRMKEFNVDFKELNGVEKEFKFLV
ncbi:MAG: threonine ammonia-lyase IlvA [Chitinophagaceae bacterium]|nr:threonine ammonia-lyase IlvA [Chitinophagaceae bacterium]